MRVLIYGGGAVGLGIASCLVRPPNRVEIVARGQTVGALQEDGLTRTGIFGRVYAGPDAFACYESLGQIDATGCDFVLICTKSFDSALAARDLAEHRGRIGEGARLVLFQNGWGNAEAFCEHFQKGRVYNARVITGFRRPRPNEVEVTVHADAIHIGSLFGADLMAIEPLCRAIHEGGIPCEKTGSIEKDLWAKMLYNCALNPLGAVLGVPYGALAEETSTRTLMNRLVEEVFAVMEKAGYRTHWQRPEEFLDVFYRKLVPDTAGHKSSMLQDIAAGKRTEIDALNGVVVQLAQQRGVTVPYNHTLCNLIQFIENREWPARE
ncbi:MAG: 2-dehydropantoate 2-reductase [Phycisphaerales bacterium]